MSNTLVFSAIFEGHSENRSGGSFESQGSVAYYSCTVFIHLRIGNLPVLAQRQLSGGLGPMGGVGGVLRIVPRRFAGLPALPKFIVVFDLLAVRCLNLV